MNYNFVDLLNAGDEEKKDLEKETFIRLAKIVLGTTGISTIILFGIVFIIMLVVASLLSSFETKPGHLGGQPTSVAMNEISPQIYPIFIQAQEKYGVSWAVLAAIAKIESGFGEGELYLQQNGVSYAGAVGFMQFMPTTWSGNSNPIAKDSPDNPIWDSNPDRISQYGGYGTDGDGDGIADPYNPWDAIFSAARYLKANNVVNDPEGALFHYNHSRHYVNQIMAQALEYSIYQVPVMEGIWPVPAEYNHNYISAVFGQVFNQEGTRVLWASGHTGIDIACPEGVPVFAVISGRVAFAGRGAGGYGNYIRIENEEGVSVAYAHLQSINVQTLTYVEQGEVIAYTGNTGRSTGPHLHFETWVNNRLTDPLLWLVPPGENY